MENREDKESWWNVHIVQFPSCLALDKIKYWILPLNRHEILQATTNTGALAYGPIIFIIIFTIEVYCSKFECSQTKPSPEVHRGALALCQLLSTRPYSQMSPSSNSRNYSWPGLLWGCVAWAGDWLANSNHTHLLGNSTANLWQKPNTNKDNFFCSKMFWRKVEDNKFIGINNLKPRMLWVLFFSCWTL